MPEGQAIMLDVNSPKLFLLLISGYFEFDRQDLMLNSTYIWIAGGSFYVGSEAAPFLHQATITLHGDRWHTIELPVIGSKMLAVTDLGGLGTCAHLYKREVRLSSRGWASPGSVNGPFCQVVVWHTIPAGQVGAHYVVHNMCCLQC